MFYTNAKVHVHCKLTTHHRVYSMLVWLYLIFSRLSAVALSIHVHSPVAEV